MAGSSVVGALRVNLGLDSAQFASGTKKAKSDAKGLEKSLGSLAQTMTGFAKSFAIGLGGGLVAGALTGLTSNLMEVTRGIAAIDDEAKRAGLSVKAFQEWKFVAEQNRIGIDALVDGFKELSLRADEFIVTGKGSAAEAFARIGFTAEDLKGKLKDPSSLMLEIIGRMERLDKAAQIRIADELFGGTGGEQFVQLLEKGEQGINQMIDRAHEVGAVMDDELIAKAQELDRRWKELTTTVGMWFKGFAVGAANVIATLVTMQETLDAILGDETRARVILGNAVYEDLKTNQQAVDENADSIRQLDAAYADLSQKARSMALEMFSAAEIANRLGNDQLWSVLSQAGNDLIALADQFANNEISAQDFAERLLEIQSGARAAFDELDRADQVEFTGAISQIDALGVKILEVIALAQSLYAWLSKAAGAASGALPQDTGTPIQSGDEGLLPPDPNTFVGTSPRPKSAPPMTHELFDPGKGGGGGKKKGGGGRSKDEFAQAMDSMREEIALLEAEAAALVEAAIAGSGYARSVDYAQNKAKLLAAAQKQGLAITPELTAQIEEQAEALARAADNASEARDRLQEIESAGERGANAIGGVFGAMLDGADAAKSALANLLMEIAKAQFSQGMLGLIGGSGGGIASTVGKWLAGSYDGGGYTWNGPRTGGLDGKGGRLALLHPQETVIDHTRGQGFGGQRVEVIPSPYFDVRVTELADQSSARMGSQINQSLPARVQQINHQPRRRG